MNNNNKQIYLPPSKLKISTITIVCNLKKDDLKDINLSLFSRCVDVYDSKSPKCETKEGCLIGLDYSTNLSSGILKNKYKKKPFYNQITIIYFYYGFRTVNIKLFNNGKLQMTGIQSEHEANIISKYIINTLKKTTIKIYNHPKFLPKNDKLITNDFSIVYNIQTGKMSYYRLNYINRINNYKLLNTLKNKLIDWSSESSLFSSDDINILWDKIENLYKIEDWVSNNNINLILNITQKLINNALKYLDTIPNTVPDTLEIIKFKSNNIEPLINIFTRFNKIYENDKIIINTILKQYSDELMPDNICKEDNKEYWSFDFIENTSALELSNLNIVLINSDFNTNFNINNTKLHYKLSNKYKLLVSYEPNDYPGVKVKYFWNKNYSPEELLKGVCTCSNLCLSMKKNKTCVQITISIFQSGSIIITGAKNINQIINAYEFINNIMKNEFKFINTNQINEKNRENQNNINRKLQRKTRLFYINKQNITNYDKIKFVK